MGLIKKPTSGSVESEQIEFTASPTISSREEMLRHSIYYEWPHRKIPRECGDITKLHTLFTHALEDSGYHSIRTFGPNIHPRS